MTGFINSGLPQPLNSQGTPWEWQRKVETFESNNVNTLETNINNWIAALKVTYEYAAILDIIYIGNGAGNNCRVLVSYGYFTPPA